MRRRTPSEIKAYGDGYAEAYKEFCHLLDKHDKDKAIRKMKIFADAVALTVETATDTADTPQTDCDKCIWSVCNYNKVDWDADTPQTDWVEDGVPSKYCDTCDYDRLNGKSLACDGCEMVNGRPTSYKPITDCGWGEPK